MNQELWNKIVAFDFDKPPTEYGFSTRLANENFWTIGFTNQAIEEYKKFMYLAATSDFMVSPSEIIDKVWHQHLIFSQSYQEFCNLIGKQIQHIPSTHNKEDYNKFKQAKERTSKFYEKEFGNQPKNVWLYIDMFESLNLEKAKIKIRTFLIIGILLFILLTTPAYFLLKSIYFQINNPEFIFQLLILTIISFFVLEYYNKSKLKELVSNFDETSFIYNLKPFELVYLKSQKISKVINGVVNELVENDIIKVNSNNSIELAKNNGTNNILQLQVTTELSELGTTFYPGLLSKLATKPIFKNIPNSMDAFRKYFNKSKKFSILFYINFAVLTFLVLLSFTRVVTGILTNKPVIQIFLVTIALVTITVLLLNRLTKQISTTTIPDLYKKDIIPTRQMEYDWQWSYFLLGTSVFTPSFVPLARYTESNSFNDGGFGSACGSSCGSSCSSCGGCGGD